MAPNTRGRRGRSHGRRGGRGRGRGSSGRKPTGGKPTSQQARKEVFESIPEEDNRLLLSLVGTTDLLNLIEEERCPLKHIETKIELQDSRKKLEDDNHPGTQAPDDSSKERSGIIARVSCRLQSWDALTDLVRWFRDVDVDPEAAIEMSSCLSKEERAKVHATVDTDSLGGLVTISDGIGAERKVTIVRSGSQMSNIAQRNNVSEETKAKARLLWSWAKLENETVSLDEAVEIISKFEAGHDMPPNLCDIWNRRWYLQKIAEDLCDATTTNNTSALREIVNSDPDAVRIGLYDEKTGKGCLHIAAGQGHLDCLEVLLQAGYPVDARDGYGITALEVALKEEQSEAQGILLRSGATEINGDIEIECHGDEAMHGSSKEIKKDDASQRAETDEVGSSDLTTNMSTISICGTDQSELIMRQSEMENDSINDNSFLSKNDGRESTRSIISDRPESSPAYSDENKVDQNTNSTLDIRKSLENHKIYFKNNFSKLFELGSEVYGEWSEWISSNKQFLLALGAVGSLATGLIIWQRQASKHRAA